MKHLLAQLARRLRHSSFRYKYVVNPTTHFKRVPLFSMSEKERMALYALSFAKQLEGDYLEFGVFEGKSFVPACHFGKQNKGMHFYAFDSFEGLPDLEGIDKDTNQFHEGKFYCSLPRFKKILKDSNIDMRRVTCVPGFYDQSLTKELQQKLPLRKAAVVWVDCDLYESTVPVLKFITPYVQDGTVIVFDDWHSYKSSPHMGEQKAFAEWLKVNPHISATEFHSYGIHGKSFVLHLVDK